MKRNVLLWAGMLYFGLAGTATAAFIDFKIAPFNTCTPGNSCTRTVSGVQVTVEGWTDVNNDNALDPLIDSPAPLWWDNLDGFGVQSSVGYEPDEIDGPEFLIVRFGNTQSVSQLSITDLFNEGSPQYLEIGYYRLTVGGATGGLVQFLADPLQVPGSTNGVLLINLPNEPADNVTFTAPGRQGSQNHEHSVAGVNVTPLSANLSITKTDSADPALLGENLTYTITVSNAGPNSAYGVTVSDTLPAGVTLVSAISSQGTCSGTSTVTCSLGTLANGANATITIIVTPTTTGSKSNTASVTSTTADPNTSNNSDTETTMVNPAANLSIVKSDAPDPAFVGQTITYSIVVTNNGPSSASSVMVTDNLPAGVSYVSAVPSTGSCTGTSSISCSLGTLGNGASATVTIVVTATATGTINNTASVSSTTGDPNPGNNSSTASTTVNPSANLSITKTDGPDPVNVGQNLTYTVTVTNNGPSSATGVTMTDTLPGGVTFVTATPSQGSCTPGSGTVTCNLGTITSGASVPISIIVTPTATGTISNSASVTSSTNDPNNGNNTVGPVDTTVNGSADLSITKTDSPDPVLVGSNLTYTITVTNNGPTLASNVAVTDTLPGGVTFVSSTPSQGACTGTSTVSCNLGSLANGASATVTIVVTPTTANPTLSNTASAASATSDPNNGNNSATTTTTVNAPSANLSITKTDSPDPVQVGGTLTYTITVSNAGPNTASNVTVTDSLPSGVTLGSATPSQGSCSGSSTVTCNLGNLASGASATVTIIVTPNATGTIVNTATVTSSTNDPNAGNNTASTSTTVDPATTTADLQVTQTVNPNPVEVGLNATFTITVTNNGPITATGVVLTNTLPPSGVNFVSATPSQGTCGAPSGGIYSCNLGTLANGASATITLVVTTTAPGVVANIVSVSGNETDPTPPNNSATTTTNVGDVSRLINISTRAPVLLPPQGMNGGFILAGNLPKTLLIRGRGPSLAGAPFNIGGTLANPTIRLVSAGTTIAQNDNWGTTDPLCLSPATACGNASQITATGKDPCQPNPGQSVAPPGCAQEAALLVTLPPGPFSVVLSGVSNTTGIGLFEVFDVDGTTAPKLRNISTRGMVQPFPNLMHGGFIIGAGTGNKQVLIRARGPSMSGAPFNVPGTLPNPTMRVVKTGVTIAQNDNWVTTDPLCLSPAIACGNAVDITATGMDPCLPNPGQSSPPPGCANEAALLLTLPPGGYNVVVSSVGGLISGLALFEVFEMSP